MSKSPVNPKKGYKRIYKNINKEKNIIRFLRGQNSSYGLDFTKKIYDGNLICVSYDWGMITGKKTKLSFWKQGVEYVWASADIQKKQYKEKFGSMAKNQILE